MYNKQVTIQQQQHILPMQLNLLCFKNKEQILESILLKNNGMHII